MTKSAWPYLIPILAVATAVRLIGIHFPFGDYDEGVYLATVRSVLHGAPLITQTYSSQGPLFIYISELFYRISPTLTSVRLFPILCSLWIIYVTFRIVDRWIGRLGAVFAAIYLSLDTSFLITSRTFQVDIPWTAFTLASFYYLLCFHESRKAWQVIFSSLLFAVGLFLKVNPLLIAPIAGYFLLTLSQRGWRHVRHALWYVISPLVVLFLTVRPSQLTTFYLNTVGIRAHSLSFHIENWDSGVRLSLLQHEVLIFLLCSSTVFWLIYRMKYGLINWLHQYLFGILSLVWLVTTAMAFSVYTNLFPHHLVFIIAPAVLVASYAVQTLYDNLRAYRPVYLMLLGGIIVYTATQGTPLFSVIRPSESPYDRTLQAAARDIDMETHPNDYVVSDDQLVLYLANRTSPPDLVDTSFVRIQSGLLPESKLETVVSSYQPQEILFVSGRLASEPSFAPYLTEHGYQLLTSPTRYSKD